jgi:hypothetical protein
MKIKTHYSLFFFLIMQATIPLLSDSYAIADNPNVVLIMADVVYGDVISPARTVSPSRMDSSLVG